MQPDPCLCDFAVLPCLCMVWQRFGSYPSHLMSWTWFCPLHLSHLLAFIASDGCNELDRLDLRWSRLFHTSLSWLPQVSLHACLLLDEIFAYAMFILMIIGCPTLTQHPSCFWWLRWFLLCHIWEEWFSNLCLIQPSSLLKASNSLIGWWHLTDPSLP